MLAIFVTLDHEILPIQRCDITLEDDRLPPNPASDDQGRLYQLKSMVAVIDPENDEPSILCWYQEIPQAETRRALRSIPVPSQAEQP